MSIPPFGNDVLNYGQSLPFEIGHCRIHITSGLQDERVVVKLSEQNVFHVLTQTHQYQYQLPTPPHFVVVALLIREETSLIFQCSKRAIGLPVQPLQPFTKEEIAALQPRAEHLGAPQLEPSIQFEESYIRIFPASISGYDPMSE